MHGMLVRTDSEFVFASRSKDTELAVNLTTDTEKIMGQNALVLS